MFLIEISLSFSRYAHGPVPLQSQRYATSQDIINSITSIQQEISKYKPCLTQVTLHSWTFLGPGPANWGQFKGNFRRCFSSTGVVQHSSQLCHCCTFSRWHPHAGSNAANYQSWVCDTHFEQRVWNVLCIYSYSESLWIPEMVPTDVQGELKHLYTAAGELLRHFWSCFPVNTPFLEEKVRNLHPIAGAVVARVHKNFSFFAFKVIKMKSNLEKFQMTKIFPFKEKIQRQYLSTNVSLWVPHECSHECQQVSVNPSKCCHSSRAIWRTCCRQPTASFMPGKHGVWWGKLELRAEDMDVFCSNGLITIGNSPKVTRKRRGFAGCLMRTFTWTVLQQRLNCNLPITNLSNGIVPFVCIFLVFDRWEFSGPLKCWIKTKFCRGYSGKRSGRTEEVWGLEVFGVSFF